MGNCLPGVSSIAPQIPCDETECTSRQQETILISSSKAIPRIIGQKKLEFGELRQGLAHSVMNNISITSVNSFKFKKHSPKLGTIIFILQMRALTPRNMLQIMPVEMAKSELKHLQSGFSVTDSLGSPVIVSGFEIKATCSSVLGKQNS